MGLTYEEILNVWREADRIVSLRARLALGPHGPVRGDIRGAALEAWTLLAALAAQTSRLRLGVMVTSNRLRSPTLLAKMAATVDIISGGRLDFGLGVGGRRVAVEDPAVRRSSRPTACSWSHPVLLSGTLLSLSRLLTDVDRGRAVRLRGRVYPAQRCHMRAEASPDATSTHIDRRLRRSRLTHYRRARRRWNYPGPPSPEFRRKNELLTEHCAAIGRDPNEIVRSMQTIVRGDDPATITATTLPPP